LLLRSGRIRPGWDDKVLADWNGLMITAMANAAAVFGQLTWASAAAAAFDFITDKLCPNRMSMHGYRQGQPKRRAPLDDSANMSRAALMLYELHGDDRYLRQAQDWVATVEDQFADTGQGGYYFSSVQATDVIARMRHGNDNAVPSGNGVMVGVLTRLWLLPGDDTYGRRAEAVVYALPLPNKVLQVQTPRQILPTSHPATGRGQHDGKATAYVCIGQTSSLPQSKSDGLQKALNRATGATGPGY